jgi:effector-binding domain-containing protein
MRASNVYEVALQQVSPRSIAAVRARVPGSSVATHFRTYLDQVYAAARAGKVQLDGQNIFVYRDVDGTPGNLDVEFGVGVAAPFAAAGNVVYSVTPSGSVATTTHWGDYGALGDAHAAVTAWCRSHDITLAGPRWEVYGHWREGAIPRTDIYCLVAPRR